MPNVRRVDNAIPLVDGFRLTEQTDTAGSGEVWRARITGGLGGARGDPLPGELDGVGDCVLRLLRLPIDEALRARACALAGDLFALDDPGLVRIQSVTSSYDGIALIFEPLPAPILPLHLLARRRQLRAGEVVTLGVALAWALAAAHRVGVAHGRLRDADVLLVEAGRPLLTGVGVMGVLGAPGSPSGDVAALERLLASLLDGESDGADRVLAALADRSVTAAELAACLAAAMTACPIELTEPKPGEIQQPGAHPAETQRERTRRRRGLNPQWLRLRWLRLRWLRLQWLRPPRGVAVALAAGALLLLAGLIGWVSASSAAQGTNRLPPARPPASTATTDWTQVLTGLDEARAALFARPATSGVSLVDAAASAAYRYDADAVESLRRRGAHAVGLRMVLEAVTVTARGERSVLLTVTDHRLPYDVRNKEGQLISHVAGRGTARHVIELRNVAAGPPRVDRWRIAG